jgi:AraC-like DNA-binding protein
LPHFTTETLAQEMAISRRQLNRKIKEYTGLTPNKYIVEIRLQKARNLFEQSPDLTVKEVSYEVGFSKTEYFSKLFKARFGKNPSELMNI